MIIRPLVLDTIDITEQIEYTKCQGIDLDVLLRYEIEAIYERKAIYYKEIIRMIREKENKGEEIEFCNTIKDLLKEEIEKDEKILLLDVIDVNSQEVTVRTNKYHYVFKIELKEKELAKILIKEHQQIELDIYYNAINNIDMYILLI